MSQKELIKSWLFHVGRRNYEAVRDIEEKINLELGHKATKEELWKMANQ